MAPRVCFLSVMIAGSYNKIITSFFIPFDGGPLIEKALSLLSDKTSVSSLRSHPDLSTIFT
jgi:hypothetical protein